MCTHGQKLSQFDSRLHDSLIVDQMRTVLFEQQSVTELRTMVKTTRIAHWLYLCTFPVYKASRTVFFALNNELSTVQR